MPRLHPQRRAPPARANPAAYRVTVVGLASIGRQVAGLLTRLGVQRLRLIDAGHVGRRAQREGYFDEDVGRLKTHATAELCHRINPRLGVQNGQRLTFGQLTVSDILIFCGDKREAQRWLRCERLAAWLFVEADEQRIRVLLAHDDRSRAACRHRLRHASRSATQSAVTSLHVAACAAGLLIAQFDRFVQQQNPPAIVQLVLPGRRRAP